MRLKIKQNILKQKKYTVILSWIFSYLIIVSIPLLTNSFLLIHSLQYMQKENRKICQAELNNLSSIMDSYFEEMSRIALEFSLNPQTTALIHTDTFSAKEHYALFELQKQMQYYKISNSRIQHIGMFFLDSDTILTNSALNPLSYKAQSIFGTELASSLENLGVQNNYYYSAENQSFIYLLSLPLSGKPPYRDYMFVTLKPDVWKEIESNQKENTFSVSFSENNSTLDLLQNSSDSGVLTLTASSKLPSITYTLVFRSSETANHIRFIQFLMICFSILSFFISVTLAVFFTRKNYKPLSQLLQKVSLQNRKHRDNEYQTLEKYIDYIQTESLSLKRELTKNHDMMEELYLSKLLRNIYSKEEFTQIAELPLWNAPAEAEEKTLAILSIYAEYFQTELSSEGNDVDDLSLLHFILKNIMGDLISSDSSWKSVLINNNFIVVIHDFLSVLNQTCNTITTQLPPLLNTFKAKIYIGISIGHETLPNIHHLYHEALEALECSQLYNMPYTYYEEKVAQQNATAKSTQILLSTQQKFRNAIITQTYDAAIAMVPELFLSFFPKEQISSMLRLNMYALINLYRSCLLELSDKHHYIYHLIDEQINSLLNCTALDALQETLISCLYSLNEQHNKHMLSSNDILINEIKNYIETHYSDFNLSAGQIAEHFDIPLSTVSKTFKKYTQTGMLDYIHHTRIHHAKALLDSQKYTVNEVASMTGYLSASSFIRIFKKHEGISPGAFLLKRNKAIDGLHTKQ